MSQPFEKIPEDIASAVEDWFAWTRNYHHASFQGIQDFVAAKNWTHLRKIMGKRLAFGTAGIRGNMGPGLVVI